MSASILGSIRQTLEVYSPDAIVAFMVVHYYGHPVQHVATGLDVQADLIYDWLRQIRSDIRRAYIRDGGHINRDGSTVATLDNTGEYCTEKSTNDFDEREVLDD